MAKSNARKLREKKVREGKLDPTVLRGTHTGLYERKTKTKLEKRLHEMHKYKKDLRFYRDEDLFIFALHSCSLVLASMVTTDKDYTFTQLFYLKTDIPSYNRDRSEGRGSHAYIP